MRYRVPVPFFLAAVSLLTVAARGAQAEDFYKDKSLALYLGHAPGSGMDSEMRLVARYLGAHIPGEPAIVPRNMPGAGGVIFANYLYSIARPDGLTLGMPGRSGFLLAPIMSVGDAKFDVQKFTWIGSSNSANYLLFLRKGANIRSLAELKASPRQLIIGASGAGTANGLVPEVLAKYEKFPLKVVRGYAGMNDIALAMERGEADGLLAQRASLRPDLISSGTFVPIFQTSAIEPDLPALDTIATSAREKALLDLLIAPVRIGLAVVAPPGLPPELTQTLRQAYFKMVSSQEYRDEAARRGFDIGPPNTGEDLAKLVADKIGGAPADVVQEYREFVEHP